ncbi:MAG: glycosyl hydrolase-related protein, partial [Chloroflexi bacterium]|nr:glycosyl hydrolase-related protein [Chloroflexota bacterium]
GNTLRAYVDKPRSWDAWDIDIGYADAGEALSNVEPIRVVESGPHRAAVRVLRRFRNSTIQQDIRLWSNSARIDFHTTADWHDRRWLLKARFPLAVRSPHATFETAFGVQERPTHRNTSWDVARFEVAAHRFADISEPGYGVALLNDGKYGHHVHDNELGLTLLRSPVYPDPLADEGTQTFTYSLLPHLGTWHEGGVQMEAEDLNRPLLGRVMNAGGDRTWSALRIDGLPLGLGVLKPAEDGGSVILRTYEPQGARGAVHLDLPDGWRAVEEVDLLEQGTGEPEFTFSPFRLHSWRLARTD